MIVAIYKYPNNGTPLDKIQCGKFKIGDKFEVTRAEVCCSYTKIYLDGYNETFNSVMFDFYEYGKELNIPKEREFWKCNYDRGNWI